MVLEIGVLPTNRRHYPVVWFHGYVAVGSAFLYSWDFRFVHTGKVFANFLRGLSA